MSVIDPKVRLLLLSTSTIHGSTYLEYAQDEIRDYMPGVRRVTFVPFALADHAAYAAKARERFEAMGFQLASLHEAGDARRAVDDAEAIFIGGGNTFRLLKAMYDRDLLDAVRARVRSGMPYMGASAGSNLACPTVRTTNDMPIVEPPSLTALGVLPWQINPHYLDPDPNSRHMGETREERLLQFHEENDVPVIGLREGGILRAENGTVLLKGVAGARIFRRGQDRVEVMPVARLDLSAASATAG